MKPIVEGMGLDWSAQLKKIKENPVLARRRLVTAVSGTADRRETVWARAEGPPSGPARNAGSDEFQQLLAIEAARWAEVARAARISAG